MLPTLVAGLAVILLVVRFVIQARRNPLAIYPGPFLARHTDLWVAYHAVRGDLSHTLAALHEKHGMLRILQATNSYAPTLTCQAGTFVRFGPNRLSSNSAEALDQIYGFGCNTIKAQWYYYFSADPEHPATNTVIDRDDHRRKRAVLNKGFTSTSMKHLEPKILNVLHTWMPNLVEAADAEDGWSAPRDMADWAVYLTNDVMGTLSFSNPFGLSTSDEHRWILQAVPLSTRLRYACCFEPWLLTSGIDRWLYPQLDQWRARIRAFSSAMLQRRVDRQDDKTLYDFFRFILDAPDAKTGGPVDARTLASESSLLVNAGGDSTGTAIAATTFFLAHNTRCLDRVKAEIRSEFTSADEIVPGSRLEECKYLRACIDEAIRLAPPAPAPLMRQVRPGGLETDRRSFPSGVELAVSPYAIHRNKEYYPDPLIYKPERWLADSVGAEAVKKAQSAFCPFSIGARQCVGMKLAYLEITLALCSLLWRYDMRLMPGREKQGVDEVGNYRIIDCFGAEKHGPWVQFRERDRNT